MEKKIKKSAIDLRPAHEKRYAMAKEAQRLKRKEKKPEIFKQETPIHEIKDVKGGEKLSFSYIKGKKYSPPKFLGNLLKIGFLGFLIILTINIVNVYNAGKSIEEDISSSAFEGYNYLLNAGKSATKIQFEAAKEAFEKAQENFAEAEKALWFINRDNTFYADTEEIGRTINGLLEGGSHFAEAGNHFLEALEFFNKIPIYFVSKNEDSSRNTPSITDTLIQGLERTNLAIDEISLASAKINSVNTRMLPTEIKAKVEFAQEKIKEVEEILKATSEQFPAILKLLGDRYPHRYLILLQNNNEIRPTGGFIGSYAIMDVNDGYIENLETFDVYDIDNAYGGIIEPPDEFKAFTNTWRFRDSNYSPDFPTSAKKARWFLQKEGGPSVDTVIAINQGLLKDMLEITGPIQVGQFGELTSENYNLLLSFVIESKAWGEEDPKHILKVFIPEFKKAIMKEANISKVSSKLYKAVQQKHIMVYSSDEEIQALFESLGMDGSVYRNEADEDYLSVINISSGGTKSDQFVEEKIQHHTHISEDGTLTNEVTVERSHLWSDSIYFEWKKVLNEYGFTALDDQIIDILGRGRNRVGMRIYVPQGVEVIESKGPSMEKKYDKDLKKDYFYTTMEIKAGESDKVWIKYKLPYKLDLDSPAGTYRITVEKQPGSRGSIFTKTVSTDKGIENLAHYPDAVRINNAGTLIYATDLVYDKYFAGVWGK